MRQPSNFSSGASGLTSSKELTDPENTPKDHLAAARKAAGGIIDSGVLGDGPYSLQISGTNSDEPGATNQLTITVSATMPIPAPEPEKL